MDKVPETVRAKANDILVNLLPDKSREKYLKTYANFMNWKQCANIASNNFSEITLVAYFGDLNGDFFIYF